MLTENNEHRVEMDTMQRKNKDLTQKLDEEQKTSQSNVATLTTVQENCNRLQQEKMQLSQNLMNEQMKVEMLRNTMSVMYRQVSNRVCGYD